MGGYILPIIGIIASFFLMKYRERFGDAIGEADWMKYFGGLYNFIIIFSLFIFFWSIAALTGTDQVLFSGLKYLIPGLNRQAPAPEAF